MTSGTITVAMAETFFFHIGYHHELTSSPPQGTVFRKHPVTMAYDHDTQQQVDYITSIDSKNIVIPKLETDNADIIHSPHPLHTRKPLIVDSDYFYYPYIYNLHQFRDLVFFRYPFDNHHLTPGMKKRLTVYETVMRKDNFHYLLSWSQWNRECFARHVQDREILEKIEVLYPAVKNSTTPPIPKKNPNHISLLFCGRPFLRKGGDIFLKLMEILQKKYKATNHELTWTIVTDQLPEKIKANFPPNVAVYDSETGTSTHKNTLKYSLTKDQLNRLYQESDILVYPSKIDSFGMVLLEAMNYHLPIVAASGSYTPVMPEIIEDGKTGFLVAMKQQGSRFSIHIDEIVKKVSLLIENKPLRQQIATEAKKMISQGKFSLEQRNKQLYTFYQKALNRSRNK